MTPAMKALYDKARLCQPKAAQIMRDEEFVFEAFGGKWQKLAFTFYTDLCEFDFLAQQITKDLNAD